MTGRRLRVAGLVLASILVAGCSGSDSPVAEDLSEAPATDVPIGDAEEATRTEAVASLLESAIPQRFDVLADDSVVLVERSSQWCSDLEADGDIAQSLVALTEAATTVRNGWASLTPFGFGPAMQRRSRLIVDFAVSPDGVHETLDGDQPVDGVSQRDLGAADERGLGVVFELATADVDASTPDVVRRCEYVTGAADLVAEELRAIAGEWGTFGPSTLADDDSVDATLQDLVSEAAFSLAGIDPQAEASDTSAARIRGVDDVFFLSDGAADDSSVGGLAPLLDEVTVERLRAALDVAVADPTPAHAMDVEVIVRTDVVSDLALSLNFSDADGDG